MIPANDNARDYDLGNGRLGFSEHVLDTWGYLDRSCECIEMNRHDHVTPHTLLSCARQGVEDGTLGGSPGASSYSEHW